MDQPRCIPEQHPDDRHYTILSLIENHNASCISKLQRKRVTSTKCKSLNELLNGGIRSQEVTEFFGDDYGAVGDFLIYVVFQNLNADPASEAIIITTNYAQNEFKLLDLCHGFFKRTKQRMRLPDFVESILSRIYIVRCLTYDDLLNILDWIPEKKYSRSRQRYLGLVTIHIFSSLFDDETNRLKRDSGTISFKLRALAVDMNCAVLVSNYQTQLSPPGDSDFDPFLESDNPAFSKLSSQWHSLIDTRIHLTSSVFGQLVKVNGKVVKSRRSGYAESTITICKMGKRDNEITD